MSFQNPSKQADQSIRDAYEVLIKALKDKHLHLMHQLDDVDRISDSELQESISYNLEKSTQHLVYLDHLASWLLKH